MPNFHPPEEREAFLVTEPLNRLSFSRAYLLRQKEIQTRKKKDKNRNKACTCRILLASACRVLELEGKVIFSVLGTLKQQSFWYLWVEYGQKEASEQREGKSSLGFRN